MSEYADSCMIYHGSEYIVEHPQYGLGEAHNDYGLGFYCTSEREMAMEWAVTEAHDGYANRYLLDLDGLRVVDLSKPPYHPLHWLSILVRNRTFDMDSDVISHASRYLQEHFPVDLTGVDVLVGWRADDNYFSFARGFLNGALSCRQLNRAIKLGGLGLQTVLVSPRAFDNIRYLDSERAFRSEYLRARLDRERRGRSGFVELSKGGFDPSDIYMVDIIRQGIKGDDPRLQAVLS